MIVGDFCKVNNDPIGPLYPANPSRLSRALEWMRNIERAERPKPVGQNQKWWNALSTKW